MPSKNQQCVEGSLTTTQCCGDVDVHFSQNIPSDYERIRVVGKGSFGRAVLYRRKDDDSLVVLKEINLHELSSGERKMALNEVLLLSRLHHPHIVSYYDSFEENGVLMIEMEYADGGTLAQFLAKQVDYIPEGEIVIMFEQMVCAVSYLHCNNVLHRDLKTANIFLTRNSIVKIGDFGISKYMGTGVKLQGAQTILGTPYYLSPEMCKGNNYNEKSDIWALGCCLYEMICLRKTFDSTSLPVLVNKIMNAEYEQIKGPYSNQIKLLIREMLRTEPETRPNAASVHEIVQRYRKRMTTHRHRHNDSDSAGNEDNDGSGENCSDDDDVYENDERNAEGRRKRNTEFNNVWGRRDGVLRGSATHSALYYFDISNVTLSTISSTPPFQTKVKQVVTCGGHSLLLTVGMQVYSWGSNEYGQLGHGDRTTRAAPTRLDALSNRSVHKIATGKSFSIFCVDQGIVMACGGRTFMGDADAAEDWLRPRIIDSLLRYSFEEIFASPIDHPENVIELACGEEHAVVLCESGRVFAWGSSASGQLGIGERRSWVASPTRVDFPTRQAISSVRCGADCTVFVTDLGTILVTGGNRSNKLCMNNRYGGMFANVKDSLVKSEVENVLTPTPLKSFPSRVVDVSLGHSHSGVLLESGRIHVFGSNADGELGAGNRQPIPCAAFKPVKALLDKVCVKIVCGDRFTMAATAENELYFWGCKGNISGTLSSGEYITGNCQSISRTSSTSSSPNATMTSHTKMISPNYGTENRNEKMTINRQDSQDSQKGKFNTNAAVGQLQLPNNRIVITLPTLVLRMDMKRTNSASVSNSNGKSGHHMFIRLASMVSYGRRVIVVIDASPSVDNNRRHCITKSRIASSNEVIGMNSNTAEIRHRRQSAPEIGSENVVSAISTWIKGDLSSFDYTSLESLKEEQDVESKPRSAIKEEGRKLIQECRELMGELDHMNDDSKQYEQKKRELQLKLCQLQALRYKVTEISASEEAEVSPSYVRPKILKNPFHPEAQTKICTIL